MKFSWSIDDSFLPEIHQRTGSRYFQDDWLIFKWFGLKVPRWVLGRPAKYPPLQLLGNQNYYQRGRITFEGDPDHYTGPGLPAWPSFGSKPIPPPGKFQLSIVYPMIFGITIPGPYFAITTKKIFGHTWHARIGWARWSSSHGERYYQLLSAAFRKDIK